MAAYFFLDTHEASKSAPVKVRNNVRFIMWMGVGAKVGALIGAPAVRAGFFAPPCRKNGSSAYVSILHHAHGGAALGAFHHEQVSPFGQIADVGEGALVPVHGSILYAQYLAAHCIA